jgi:hypothetical protein
MPGTQLAQARLLTYGVGFEKLLVVRAGATMFPDDSHQATGSALSVQQSGVIQADGARTNEQRTLGGFQAPLGRLRRLCHTRYISTSTSQSSCSML